MTYSTLDVLSVKVKNKVNNVEISGSFSGLVGDHFATLPVGYRPPYDVVIPIKTATGFNVVNITASDGYMTLGDSVSTSNGPHYIHGTLFMT